MKEKEYRERTLVIGEREIRLQCPICGGEAFDYKERMVRIGPMNGIMKAFLCYECQDCGYILWFSEDARERFAMEPELTPVERFENEFARYSEKKLRKIIDSDNYMDDAKTAARNLLRRR